MKSWKSLGDQTCNYMSEEWAEFMNGEGKQPSLVIRERRKEIKLNVQACCETGMDWSHRSETAIQCPVVTAEDPKLGILKKAGMR